MVEGPTGRADLDDVADHSIQIPENVTRRYAQDTEALVTEHGIAPRIALWPVTEIVRLTVNLDDQAPFQAGEIGR